MTEITATLLRQLVHQPSAEAAARILHVMTGCTIVTDTAGLRLVFKRQTGKAKLTHLVLTYNAGTDLYDLKAHRLNKRTGDCPVVWDTTDVYAEDLKRISEEVTGLYFTL
jgi:hypothetical protein